jgi:antibiotic biosynthesis monooxygenase (ABM) superfamily enzyme
MKTKYLCGAFLLGRPLAMSMLQYAVVTTVQSLLSEWLEISSQSEVSVSSLNFVTIKPLKPTNFQYQI